MDENIRQIEINGIKMEVDLRTVKVIDTYKVGDNVKILKKSYSEDRIVYPGVIIDFVNFTQLPTIVVAYFKNDYCGTDIQFEYINEKSENVEIAPCLPHELELNKGRVIDRFNILIDKKKTEMEELIAKRDYFVQNFTKYFEERKENI